MPLALIGPWHWSSWYKNLPPLHGPCLKHHPLLLLQVRTIKASLNAAADAGQAVKFELVAAKQENERLQSNVVQVGRAALSLGKGCLGRTLCTACTADRQSNGEAVIGIGLRLTAHEHVALCGCCACGCGTHAGHVAAHWRLGCTLCAALLAAAALHVAVPRTLTMWLLTGLQSPEKFKRVLAELYAAVDSERAVVADTGRRSREVQARLETITKVRRFNAMFLKRTGLLFCPAWLSLVVRASMCTGIAAHRLACHKVHRCRDCNQQAARRLLQSKRLPARQRACWCTLHRPTRRCTSAWS